MDILVTGCTGLVGAHACARLLSENSEIVRKVIAVFVNDTEGKEERAEELVLSEISPPGTPGTPGTPADERLSVIRYRDAEAMFDELPREVANRRPHVVFHLENAPDVRKKETAEKDPDAGCDDLKLHVRIVKAAQSIDHFVSFVYASRSDVYGSLPEVPAHETDHVRPATFGASVNAAREQLVSTLGSSLGVDTVALRFFGVVGNRLRRGGSRESTLVICSGDGALEASLISSPETAERECRVFRACEDDTVRRDFVHVLDIADAIASLLRHKAAEAKRGLLNPRVGDASGSSHGISRAYNVGTGCDHALRDIIDFFCLEPDPSEDGRDDGERRKASLSNSKFPSVVVADISEARRDFGYAPRHVDPAGFARACRSGDASCDDQARRSELRASIARHQASTGNRRVAYTVTTDACAVFVNGDDIAKSAMSDSETDYICIVAIDAESQDRDRACSFLEKYAPSSWRVVRSSSRSNLFPTDGEQETLSREIKMTPHKFFDCYDESLYFAFDVRMNNDVTGLWDRALRNKGDKITEKRNGRCTHYIHDVAVFRRNDRGGLLLDAEDARRCRTADAEVEKQVATYKKDGVFTDAESYGLKPIRDDVVFRRHNVPSCVALMRLWCEEALRWPPSCPDRMAFVRAWLRWTVSEASSSGLASGSADEATKTSSLVNVLPLRDSAYPESVESYRDVMLLHGHGREAPPPCPPYHSLLNYYFCRPFANYDTAGGRRRARACSSLALWRPVFFLKQYPQGGRDFFRAEQMCEALCRYNVRASVIDVQSNGNGPFMRARDPALTHVQNAAVIIVGRLPYPLLPHLKARGNTVVFDFDDELSERLHARPDEVRKILEHVDAVVFPSDKARRDVSKLCGVKPSVVIRRHWDPRLTHLLSLSRDGYGYGDGDGDEGRRRRLQQDERLLFGFVVGSPADAIRYIDQAGEEGGFCKTVLDLARRYDARVVIDAEKRGRDDNSSSSGTSAGIEGVDAVDATEFLLYSANKNGSDIDDRDGKKSALRRALREIDGESSSSSDRRTKNDHSAAAYRFGCHVRLLDRASPKWKYAADRTIATAAFFGAPIVTTRDDAASELLPRNYPYFVDYDAVPASEDGFSKSVESVLERVKKTHRKDQWNRAANAMREVRRKTSLDETAKEYVRLLLGFECA